MTLARRAVVEALGTAFLLMVVVGSGIMGERLAGGNVAVALLANSLATGAGLVALILTLGPLSGAHFNPAVTAALAGSGLFPTREVPTYFVAQFLGAVLGVWSAHAMFELPVFELSAKARPGIALAWSEAVATFGLLIVILIGVRQRSTAIPYAVGAYISAAYWFTASTSFANPAVTFARALTESFAGIQLGSVPGFVAAQAVATVLAVSLVSWLWRPTVPQ